jgi:hypothetical protein
MSANPLTVDYANNIQELTPRGNPRRDETWVWFSERLLNLPNPKPSNQTDWPLPRARARLLDYTQTEDLLQTTLNRPLGNASSTFPVFTPRTSNTWISNLLENTLVPAPRPFVQSSWPVPSRITWNVPWVQSLVLRLSKPPVVIQAFGGRQLTEREVLSSWMKAIRRLGR